jgi:hypothetical protein
MSNAKAECEELLNAVMPFAEQCLSNYREFFPFGATMSQSGEIALAAATDGEEEQPPSEELIELLTEGFREGARNREYRATGLVYDALTVPPGKNAKQDTIICAFDHQDNYSIKICFPYQFDADDELVIEDPYAVEGEYEIFGNSPS